jgi:TRAP-type mannitol/chloroaromatic compound transport system substrate-binding protein
MNRKHVFSRRAFIFGASALALSSPARLLAGSGKQRWRMAVPWSAREKVLLQGSDRFVRQISLLTESRLSISMHAAGTLAGADGVLEAVLSGKAQCGHVFANTLASKSLAAEWFFSVPFGMSPTALNHWFYVGEGLPLLRDVARSMGLIALPMGDTGPRPTGWFSRALAQDGLGGLTAAYPGRLAAAVLERSGASMADFSVSEGPEALYRGDVAGLGSRGAYLDLAARFNASAGHFYLPCGLTPSGRMLFIARRDAFDDLPAILRKLVEAACAQEDIRLQADMAYAESEALRRIRSGHNAKTAEVPAGLAAAIRSHAASALDDLADADGLAAKVHGKYKKFLAEMQPRMESF